MEYLVPIYRKTNHYAALLDEFIKGNPDELKTEDLHSQAWAIATAYFHKSLKRATAQYKELAGTSRTNNDFSEIVLAAHEKRVATLLVTIGVQCWGTCDARTYRIEMHEKLLPGGEDLLNLAAIRAYASGGMVFAVSRRDARSQTRCCHLPILMRERSCPIAVSNRRRRRETTYGGGAGMKAPAPGVRKGFCGLNSPNYSVYGLST